MLFDQRRNSTPYEKEIQELSREIVYSPEMIPVVKIDEGYYTDFDFLIPYMKSNGIDNIADAISNITIANGLKESTISILINPNNEYITEISAELAEDHRTTKARILAKSQAARDREDNKQSEKYRQRRAEKERNLRRYTTYGDVKNNADLKSAKKAHNDASNRYFNAPDNDKELKAKEKDMTKAARKVHNMNASGYNRVADRRAVRQQYDKHYYNGAHMNAVNNTDRSYNSKDYELSKYADAINRHNRKHPDNKITAKSTDISKIAINTAYKRKD